jgi:transcriptional regulator with XRE-family HTH domain
VSREQSAHTAGSRALNGFVKEHGDVKRLAEKLGCAEHLLSKWLHGKRKPTAPDRARIEDELQIGWRLWDEEDPEAKAGPGSTEDAKGAA